MSENGRGETERHAGRFAILSYLCAVAVIAYIQRAAISVPAKQVAADLHFDAETWAWEMGLIQSAWYWSYAFVQLPAGWFADRVGSRRALAIFCTLWSLATFLTAFATSFPSLLALWSLMGAAQAGAFPCAAKAIGEVFPETHRARASGLLAAGMAIGGAIAPALTAALLTRLAPYAEQAETHPWRLLLAAYSLPGFVWTAAFLFAIPASRLSASSGGAASRSAIDWRRLLSSGPLALLCAQQFFRAAGMVFFLTWFPTFLQKARGVSTIDSGFLTTMAGIGGVLGSLLGGFVSDWMFRKTGNARLSRQGIAVAGMGSCSLLIIASHFIADVNASIALISLGAFCATFGGVSGYTVAIQYGGRGVATVFSAMNMCGNIGAALFPVTAAWLVGRTGNWDLMLFLFAGIMAVDAVCWAILNPRGTLFGETDEPS